MKRLQLEEQQHSLELQSIQQQKQSLEARESLENETLATIKKEEQVLKEEEEAKQKAAKTKSQPPGSSAVRRAGPRTPWQLLALPLAAAMRAWLWA
mmetsp:Transcript_13147/g.40708  ORF Transcript_13147/g.40708 Transcript_13147/m.40708 type:complete len:96 (-) Transcript_13147:94-381(-)